MANVIKPTETQQVQATNQELQNSQSQNMGSFNRLSQRSPYDGALDKNGELRLRLAMVDNPEITRNANKILDPLDVKNIVNLSTGKITLKWLDIPGGAIRSSELGGKWEEVADNSKYNPEEREFDNWDIQSRREMVELTHPFMWANNKNWAGFNYIPPVGSIVIVGFRKQGLPIILGYAPTHFKICYPVLQPGEMSMKGFGNNYAHWRWSDKTDFKVWSIKDEIDIDDPKKIKKNETDCTLWLRLNANDRYIKMQATEVDKSPQKAHQSHSTTLTISPKSLQILSTEIFDEHSPNHSEQRYSNFLQDEEGFELQTFNPKKTWSTTYKQDASRITLLVDDDTSDYHTMYNQKSNTLDITISEPGKTSSENYTTASITSSVTINGIGSNTLLTNGTFTINADNINMNSKSININNEGTFNLSSGGSVDINGATINLN
jgi:hypothetical protein